MDKNILINAGIDVDSALERFMGNEMLLTRFLGKFIDDTNYEKLCNAISSKNKTDAITASHTMKGVCGNLSMTRLYELLTNQVSLLRADKFDEAALLMGDISDAYSDAIEAIKNSI